MKRYLDNGTWLIFVGAICTIMIMFLAGVAGAQDGQLHVDVQADPAEHQTHLSLIHI